MPKYTAITIGPIFDTLAQARSTRAMWTASYMFSWIMREMLVQVRTKYNNDLEILNAPPTDKKGKIGAGLFPDRFVARHLTETNVDLGSIARKVVNNLAGIIANDLNNTKKLRNGLSPQAAFSQKNIEAFLLEYLRLRAVEFESDTKNPVKDADAFLHSAELQATLPSEQEHNYLQVFFEDVFFNAFIVSEFEKGDEGFASTVEIATAGFEEIVPGMYAKARAALRKIERASDKRETDKQEDFLNAIRGKKTKSSEFEKSEKGETLDFRLCHKYIAIVRADGDKMGAFFQTLIDNNQTDTVKTVSGQLTVFAQTAVQKIKDYKGVPVYAGGDDLLFFAPVRTTEKNILNLLDELDECFTQTVLADLSEEIKNIPGIHWPTMSYGISISYYKFPLAESLQIANNELFSNLKNADKRNGVAFRVTKHSGSFFDVAAKKEDRFYTTLRSLLKEIPADAKSDFLNSVAHKLDSLHGLFRATADNPQSHFHHILFNNFDEKIHRDEKDSGQLSPFMKQVETLLLAAFAENPVKNDEDKAERTTKNLRQVYGVLRFADFLFTQEKN